MRRHQVSVQLTQHVPPLPATTTVPPQDMADSSGNDTRRTAPTHPQFGSLSVICPILTIDDLIVTDGHIVNSSEKLWVIFMHMILLLT
jgi:hypothetical protein